MSQHWTDPKREMHSDMFLLVVCYASACSLFLAVFPSPYEILSRFKEVSFVKSLLPVCAVSLSLRVKDADTVLKEATAAIS